MFFSDIIGQEAIKQRLRQAVAADRVAHAQLFYGRNGVGKLPLALAYAQYLCCEARTETDSCGLCPSCVKFAKLSHPDLHFVFPIVKRGSGKDTLCDEYLPEFRDALIANPYLSIDEWQDRIAEGKQTQIYASEGDEIIRKLNLKVFEADYKVMLIWCPEKMNETSANRLLKILEEPMGKTLFLLVSDAPDGLLATIQSRVQQLRIPPIDEADMLSAAANRFPALPEGTRVQLIRNARGSWSDFRQQVEQRDETTQLFARFVEMMRLAWTYNISEIRVWNDAMQELGRIGQLQFLALAQREIRENFVLRVGQPELSYLNGEERQFSEKFARFIHEGNIWKLMEALSLAEAQIAQNVSGRLVFFDLVLQIGRLLKVAQPA